MIDFDTFTKIAYERGRFGSYLLLKALKSGLKSNKSPNLVTLGMAKLILYDRNLQLQSHDIGNFTVRNNSRVVNYDCIALKDWPIY